MRKTIRLMAMLAVGAALLTTACGKDDPTDDPTPDTPTPVNPVDPDPVDPDPEDLTADWVDLGLPSGLLWAKCNLGANSPEEYGDYYAWGEIEPKEVYDWNTYMHCNGGYGQLTKYCTDPEYGYNGFTDNLTTLQAVDDAATAKLGTGVRMPTADEWRELIANTTAEWTTENGVNGRRLTASNGKSLFLPAAGRHLLSDFYYAGEIGGYWSSSLVADSTNVARNFEFTLEKQFMTRGNRRCGMSVRPVRPAL